VNTESELADADLVETMCDIQRDDPNYSYGVPLMFKALRKQSIVANR